ncbi:MAG: beta-propeller fold lactonase family protein, partial [Pirellulales bacterium]
MISVLAREVGNDNPIALSFKRVAGDWTREGFPGWDQYPAVNTDIDVSSDGGQVFVTKVDRNGYDVIDVYDVSTRQWTDDLFAGNVAIADSPNGDFVYGLEADQIDVHSRIANDISDNPIQVVTVGVSAASEIAVSDNGEFVYVISESNSTLSVYSRNTADGLLTFVQTIQDSEGIDLGGPRDVIVRGTSVYVPSAEGIARFNLRSGSDWLDLDAMALTGDNAVAYGLDSATGNLVAVELSSGAVVSFQTDADLEGASSLAVTAAHLVVANPTTSNLVIYSRDTNNGSLTKVGTMPLSTGGSPTRVKADPNADVFFVISDEGSVDAAIFRFELISGTWSQTHVTTESSENFTDLDISNDGYRVYVAGSLGADSIRAYNTSDVQRAPEASGAIAGSPSVILDSPYSPDGNHIYTINGSNQIEIYNVDSVDPNVVISNFRTVTDGDDGVRGLEGVSSLAISDDGRYVFAASNSSDTLVVFLRDSGSGDLQFVQLLRDTGALPLGNPNALAVAGGSLLVASDEDFSVFSIANLGDVQPTTFNVGFENIEDLTLQTGGSADFVQQLTAPNVGTMTIDTDAGADSVDIRATASELTVNTGAGDDEVTLAGTTAGNVSTINTDAGEDFVEVRDAVETLNVNAGDDDDTIRIDGTAVADGKPVIVDGGAHILGDTLQFAAGAATIHPDTPAVPDGSIAFDSSNTLNRVEYVDI